MHSAVFGGGAKYSSRRAVGNNQHGCLAKRSKSVYWAKLISLSLFLFNSIASANCAVPVFQNGKLSIPTVQVVLPTGDANLYKANLDYSSVPMHPGSFSLASSEAVNPVDLIITTIPSPLRIGEQGYLQIQLIPNSPIASATLEVLSSSDALEITPARMPLNNLVPPSVGSGSATSPPDPPALGVVPVVNFQVKVLRAGSFPVAVEFRADCGAIKRQINIKGE